MLFRAMSGGQRPTATPVAIITEFAEDPFNDNPTHPMIYIPAGC
jgi:hypothetical protein